MPRKRKISRTITKSYGIPKLYYVAVLAVALVLSGVYYENQTFYRGGGLLPSQGRLKVFSLFGGSYVVASIVVTGSATFTGVTTADESNPLTFALNASTYTVTGTLNGEVQTSSALVTVGGSTSVTLTFVGIIVGLTGTWVKQGIVLSDSQGINEPSVIYDGNPQVLAGHAYVYKMWYRTGWDTTNVAYAESVDGLTWVKYSGNPVLGGGGHSCPQVFKYNGLYYMYVHAVNEAGATVGAFSRYISGNGLSWTLDALNSVPTGSGWDQYLGNPFVWVENGTWKIIYEGIGTGNQWNLGLATSSDGKVWTKYSGNPVLMDGGGAYVIKSGGTYYMWYHAGQLPTDIYLTTSKDLVSWTQRNLVLARTLPWEGVGSSQGQVADPTVLVVGTKVWMWYVGVSEQVLGYQSVGAAILQPS